MRIAMIGQKGIVLGVRAGGIERHVAELSKRLADTHNQVSVYARARYSEATPAFQDGVRLFYPPTIYSKHLEAIVHVFLATLHAMYKGQDIYHYHGVGPALLSFLPRVFAPRAKVVVTFHAQDQYHLKWGHFARRVLRLGEWIACRVPHSTIVVSHELQVVCRSLYGAQVVYIPNGASTRRITDARELAQFNIKPDGYLLTVGRLLEVKGIHHLIRAFRTLETQKKLVIVGAPSEKDDYLERLKKLAEGDPRVVFLGFQSGRVLDQLYAHAYLYCQPSESEGLPLSVLEAMGLGTSVLVSDIPGNLEAIHRSGFTFENKDVEDLHQQLAYLIAHPKDVERAQKEVQHVVETRFDWSVIAEKTEEVYRSIRH